MDPSIILLLSLFIAFGVVQIVISSYALSLANSGWVSSFAVTNIYKNWRVYGLLNNAEDNDVCYNETWYNYYYNITNWEEVRNDSSFSTELKFREVGPYIVTQRNCFFDFNPILAPVNYKLNPRKWRREKNEPRTRIGYVNDDEAQFEREPWLLSCEENCSKNSFFERKLFRDDYFIDYSQCNCKPDQKITQMNYFLYEMDSFYFGGLNFTNSVKNFHAQEHYFVALVLGDYLRNKTLDFTNSSYFDATSLSDSGLDFDKFVYLFSNTSSTLLNNPFNVFNFITRASEDPSNITSTYNITLSEALSISTFFSDLLKVGGELDKYVESLMDAELTGTAYSRLPADFLLRANSLDPLEGPVDYFYNLMGLTGDTLQGYWYAAGTASLYSSLAVEAYNYPPSENGRLSAGSASLKIPPISGVMSNYEILGLPIEAQMLEREDNGTIAGVDDGYHFWSASIYYPERQRIGIWYGGRRFPSWFWDEEKHYSACTSEGWGVKGTEREYISSYSSPFGQNMRQADWRFSKKINLKDVKYVFADGVEKDYINLAAIDDLDVEMLQWDIDPDYYFDMKSNGSITYGTHFEGLATSNNNIEYWYPEFYPSIARHANVPVMQNLSVEFLHPITEEQKNYLPRQFCSPVSGFIGGDDVNQINFLSSQWSRFRNHYFPRSFIPYYWSPILNRRYNHRNKACADIPYLMRSLIGTSECHLVDGGVKSSSAYFAVLVSGVICGSLTILFTVVLIFI